MPRGGLRSAPAAAAIRLPPSRRLLAPPGALWPVSARRSLALPALGRRTLPALAWRALPALRLLPLPALTRPALRLLTRRALRRRPLRALRRRPLRALRRRPLRALRRRPLRALCRRSLPGWAVIGLVPDLRRLLARAITLRTTRPRRRNDPVRGQPLLSFAVFRRLPVFSALALLASFDRDVGPAVLGSLIPPRLVSTLAPCRHVYPNRQDGIGTAAGRQKPA